MSESPRMEVPCYVDGELTMVEVTPCPEVAPLAAAIAAPVIDDAPALLEPERREFVEHHLHSLFGGVLPEVPGLDEVADWVVVFYGTIQLGGPQSDNKQSEFRIERTLYAQPHRVVWTWAYQVAAERVLYLNPNARIVFQDAAAAAPYGHVLVEFEGFEVEKVG